MKNILIIFFMLAAGSSVAQTYSFVHDGNNRSYIVHLPAGYTSANAYPLVLNFHGYTSTGAQQQAYCLMDQVADTAGFIVVYPDGIGNAWNVGFGLGAYFTGADDVGFVNALLDTLIAHYNIDQQAVYATGMSNGGYFSNRLACELPHRIAAIASVTGTMTDSTHAYCNPGREVPAMHIHGTADPIVNYNGAPQSYSVSELVDYWKLNNNCPASPVTIPYPDTNPGDNCTASMDVYGPCNNQSEVVVITINNGGHTWPGGAIDIPLYGNTNRDFFASGVIWNFFKKFRLNQFIGLENEPAPWINVHPNPVHRELYISPGVEYILYNGKGKVFKQGVSNDIPLDVTDLTIGMYYIQLKTPKTTVVRKIIKI